MIFRRIANWYFTKKAIPYWCILVLDLAIVFFSGQIGIYFQIGGGRFASTFWPHTWGLLISLVFFTTAFKLFRTYKGVIRYSSFIDLQKIAGATLVGSAASFLFGFVVNAWDHGAILMPTMFVATAMFILSTLAMFVARVTVKIVFDNYKITEKTQKCFIYGIQDVGIALAKDIETQSPRKYVLTGFVSPDGNFSSEYIMGVRIRLDNPDTVRHMKEAGATVLLVSPHETENFRTRESLISELLAAGIKIMMIPSAEQWDGKSNIQQRLHEVDIEDLLARENIEIDNDAIWELLSGHRVMITGAAGSIGSEIARQIAAYKPDELILLDHDENRLFELREAMACHCSDVPCETLVTSITDKVQMEEIFLKYRPDYVFHAAAYRTVQMLEDNPAQAVRNNIFGTRMIADLAVKYGTRKFVMISTDKAVSPANVMGCSKRICEIYCQSLNQAIVEGKVAGKTQFVTTRFGNVLGSNSSVIELFRNQIKDGGPVTVAHPDMIRYFMLVSDACKLVLQAGAMGKGGEIFVFDMGAPVKIVNMAKKMIALSGVKDIKIRFSGLREGEKLYEEPINDNEETIPTSNPKIMIVQTSQCDYDYDTICRNEEELLHVSFSQDDMAIVRKMKYMVPEYKSKFSRYELLDR